MRLIALLLLSVILFGSSIGFGQSINETTCEWLSKLVETATVKDVESYTLSRYAECLLTGVGVARDVPKAKAFFSRAAEKGDKISRHILASLFVFESADSSEQEKGFQMLLKEYERGSAFSAGKIGMAYHNGLGVEQSDEEAMRYYEIAAQAGMTLYQFILAHIYEMGYYGKLTDVAKSSYWKDYEPKIHVYEYDCAIYDLYREKRVFPENTLEQEKRNQLCNR